MAQSRKGGRTGTGMETETLRAARGGGTGPGTVKVEEGASRDSSGVQRQKGVCWWRMCWSTGSPTMGGRYRLVSAPTTFVTSVMGDCSQY